MKKLLLLVATAVLVAACSSDGGDSDPTTTAAPAADTTAPADPTTAPSGGDDPLITIEGFDFGIPIEVGVGQEVTIRNVDAVPHTWTSNDDAFDSGSISGGGGEFTFAFDEAGDYGFFCTIHPTMTGSISVTG